MILISKRRLLAGLLLLASFVLLISYFIQEPHALQAQIPPYEQSPVIANLTWAPESTIKRDAFESDNFPLTWADDDKMYTAYGDGFGFDSNPNPLDKTSLGFASISGDPDNFVGVNIDSPNELKGDGPNVPKSSGLLMVDGVLYMWLRNVIPGEPYNTGCRLGWSTDNAVNWAFSDWIMAEFGFCSFINFGKNYEHARDDYVYTVSHNHPAAYRSSRVFILMRVPKDRMREIQEYEYFTGLDDDGEPTWSYSVEDREAVFTRTQWARRSSITYNQALQRYFWWQGFNNVDDVRHDLGGFGVYDAPEPWGPWTQVFYTESWDMPAGDLGSFPSKWMSDDGLTMHLVFSGSDAFSVRKATLELYVTPTPTPTDTVVPTATPMPTPTSTSSPTPTSTSSPTPTVTNTISPEETRTPRPTATATPTATPTFTSTPDPLLDTDNDGITDVNEDLDQSGVLTDDDLDGDGIPNFQDPDDDGDGIPTSAEIAQTNGQSAENLDSDGDGIFDYLDKDDDGDGISTIIEGQTDYNSNGTPDYLDTSAVVAVLLPLVVELRPTPTPVAIKTVAVRISSDSDDAEEDHNHSMTVESSDLELGLGITGIRFVNLPMPQGSRILTATVRFGVDRSSDDEASFVIYGQDINNAPEFHPGENDITYRTRTSALALWENVPQWVKLESGPKQTTPNLSHIVQEIVNRPGWQAGNAIVFFISGSGERVAESSNNDPHLAPLLEVAYIE